MRHGMDHTKLGRDTPHRKAMFANMAVSLLKNGRIETTVGRAKQLRRVVEKLITKAKEDTVHRRRLARSMLRSVEGVTILFNDVAPRFKTRMGGYTRVLKKSMTRTGDSAEMAYLEFVDYVLPTVKSKDEKKKEKEAKKSEKDLEKQATGAGKGVPAKKEAAPKKESKKGSSGAGGPKKTSTVRKIGSS